MQYLKQTCLLISFLLLTLPSGFAQRPIKDLKPTVILISLDGFRYDYLDKYSPPTLNSLAKNGVRAKWMIPSFPTKTFPNHYTIATGLYPEHHGIIENNIRDFGVTFTLGNRDEVQNSRWWLGEPIWVTAEKQNVRSAAYFFVGTEAEIMGKRPSVWKQYDGKIPNPERVDTVLSWLDLPKKKRPRMITMYFSDTDDTGHGYSPESNEVRNAVAKVDSEIKRLIDGLAIRKVDKKVNVIVVSDHGMATVDQRNAIIMDDFLDEKMLEIEPLKTGEIWQIFPKTGEIENVMQGLAKIHHAACWRKNEIPERLNYRDSPRIAPIICSSEPGWVMTDRSRFENISKRSDFLRPRGAHGYDNKYQEMQATFIAHGKAFKRGYIAEPFENVEVYNLMCKILKLKPAKNDGDLDRVKKMLR